MARQFSRVIKITGPLGDLSFYKSNLDGFLVRQKSSLDAARISRDPAFVRTRENASEFGNAVKAGTLLRRALRQVLSSVRDGRLNARMNQLMMRAKDFDLIHMRGNRRAAEGFRHPEALQLLQGFEFNSGATLGQILRRSLDTEPGGDVIGISGFQPATQIKWPEEATHCAFRGILIHINFETESAVSGFSKEVVFDREDLATYDLSLDAEVASLEEGLQLQLLLLHFMQEINGEQYPLQGRPNNTLTVVSARNL